MVKDKARKQRLGELPEEAIDRITKVASADLDNVLGGSDMNLIVKRVTLAVTGVLAITLTVFGIFYVAKKRSQDEFARCLLYEPLVSAQSPSANGRNYGDVD